MRDDSRWAVLHEYPVPAMPVSVWHHASLAVSIAAPNAGTVKLAIDGVSVVDAPLAPPAALTLSRVTLSENYTPSSFDGLFDDFFCDIR